MDRDALVPVGAFVIISFLLFGLIVMGCMLYWNWSHRKQGSGINADNISNGNACIYEKTAPRAYARSSKCHENLFLRKKNYYTHFLLFATLTYFDYSHVID